MSKTIFIDTQFVVARVNRRDQHHARALALADCHKESTFLITEPVLIEIADTLARGFKREAAEIIERFLAAPNVEVVKTSPDLFDEAFELFRSHLDKDWGLTDCISFTAMRGRGDSGSPYI